MSGKSGRGQGKHSSRSKRKKSRQEFSATAASQQVAAPSYQRDVLQKVPSAATSEPASIASTATPKPKPTTARYPFIAAELKRIGILAGAMVAILVILAVVLP